MNISHIDELSSTFAELIMKTPRKTPIKTKYDLMEEEKKSRNTPIKTPKRFKTQPKYVINYYHSYLLFCNSFCQWN